MDKQFKVIGVACKNCSKTFLKRDYKSCAIKFCSRLCANLFNASKLSKNRKGNLNPMYGKKPANYKGGHLTSDGYRCLIINNRKVREHRYIMEKHLDRKLLDNEDVHHIDGNKINNNINNLQVIEHGEHKRLHATKGGGVYVQG